MKISFIYSKLKYPANDAPFFAALTLIHAAHRCRIATMRLAAAARDSLRDPKESKP
jgi:hypothetical protein